MSNSINGSSYFHSKTVYELSCKHCSTVVCNRGMKAILLGDTRVELYSTDSPPSGRVQLVDKDYMTCNCHCKIRDLACLVCGNVIGYHVTHPCEACLESCNNGHFWMFLSDGVTSRERLDASGKNFLLWARLPGVDSELEETRNSYFDLLCR
ncbi:protein FAM72 [Neocallimastix lanati (nom. inval.)]|nr:protein FAM72 [Neocallimastix sp. JGI-2020a]